MNKRSTTFLARFGLAASAAAALVACGGNGDDAATATGKAGLRLLAIDPARCAANPAQASTGGVVPMTCDYSNLDAPPSSCNEFIGAGTLEVKVRPETGEVWYSGLSSTPLDIVLSPSAPYTLDWSNVAAGYDVVGVIVKNGSRTNVYDYTTSAATADQGLVPPSPEASIFHYNVCLVPVTTTPAQWCSPGYWKTHNTYPGDWPVDPTTIYTLSTLTVKRTGSGCASAPGNGVATLFDVVSKPQCYGGEAANLVGDYLSAEKGLNFTGERVDNCPLN